MKRDFGLLALRVLTGGFMLFGHGIGKIKKYSVLHVTFPDPLGIGSMWSVILVIFAEVLCAAMVMLGMFTRIATVPLMATMFIAAGFIHANDPWSKKEFALLYFIPFFALFLTGPGKFSLDYYYRRRD